MMRVLKARQPGQKNRRPAVTERLKADPSKPSAVRIAEHALRNAGWSVAARREILRLIKAGVGDAPFVHKATDQGRLTETGTWPTSGVTHARCCECQGLNPDALGPPALRDAADPIDK
jgi:hypothetical protein